VGDFLLREEWAPGVAANGALARLMKFMQPHEPHTHPFIVANHEQRVLALRAWFPQLQVANCHASFGPPHLTARLAALS